MLHEQILAASDVSGVTPEFKGEGTLVRGAVLFSDASGFTALTEQLAQAPHGAERLCAIINEFFGILIGIVTSYGGDIIKFAGDAVSARCLKGSARIVALSLRVHIRSFPFYLLQMPRNPLPRMGLCHGTCRRRRRARQRAPSPSMHACTTMSPSAGSRRRTLCG